jgi:hypothetical protein
VNQAEENPEIAQSPDAPQRVMTAAGTASGTWQVHHAPLCAAPGSKLKGLLRVSLRLPCSWALALMNTPWPALHAAHRKPWPSPSRVVNPLALDPGSLLSGCRPQQRRNGHPR